MMGTRQKPKLLNSDERLVQLDLELCMIRCDLVYCSEPRFNVQDVFVKESHRLICSSNDEVRSPASGLTILIYRRLTTSSKIKFCFHDSVVAIKFKMNRIINRLIVVYLLHVEGTLSMNTKQCCQTPVLGMNASDVWIWRSSFAYLRRIDSIYIRRYFD